MSRFRFRLRLTHKIAAIGAVGVMGLLLIAGIYFVGASSQDSYSQLERNAQSMSGHASKLFEALLQSRRAEKDFLLRHDMKYAENHAALAKVITQEIGALLQQARAEGKTDLAAQIEQVGRGYAVYAKHFATVVEGKRRLGLNENSGLEGTLRKSVHAIETRLNEFDQPRLTVLMLMMRRHEKDFMLRRTAKYGDDIKKRGTEFTASLAKTDIPPAAKDDILQKLAAYQRDFLAWMDTALAVGREEKAVSESYAAIEPVILSVGKNIGDGYAQAAGANEASRASTRQQMQLAIVLIILAVAACALLIGRAVSKPLSAMTAAMRQLANGNFEVVLPGLGRADEVGEMAQAVETFKVKAAERARREVDEKGAQEQLAAAERKRAMHQLADQFQTVVGVVVDKVSTTSMELEDAAGTLTETAGRTQTLSGSVAVASEQTSANVQSVASATEEMIGSIGEIARQVRESSKIAVEAVTQASKTDVRIGELSQAAARIGDVVKLITAVAQQTNLLALNATIEAARAGEAGKGFAVVAQEVKALAAQTARATDEIGTQIAGMQVATQESVAAIKEIGSTIRHIADISASISAAVEEQGACTQEIARNVQQAAQGTTQVAANIGDVNRGASDTGSASAQVLSSAQSLAAQSTSLKTEVERFLATVRAA